MSLKSDPSAPEKAESSGRLRLSKAERLALWDQVQTALENYFEQVSEHKISPQVDVTTVKNLFRSVDFSTPMRATDAIAFAVRGLENFQLHTSHPNYFGVFNPSPTTMGIFADTLVAGYNPQLASWASSPFALEMERHLLTEFGKRFGYLDCEGTFTSGGAEANHTALLTALVKTFPEFSRKGMRGLGAQPVLYVSRESHHSFLKAARLVGLGTDALREISVTSDLKMDVAHLTEAIKADRASGHLPFFVVATAGSTSAGVVDPIAKIAQVTQEQKLWLHVDAAWGGAAAFLPELAPLFEGMSLSDSLTFDAHKWMNIPMGAGMYLTPHKNTLDETFHISTHYMYRPQETEAVPIPYAQSMQWSRRFIGLKVFLSLAVAGWEGYTEVLRHQIEMGNQLKRKLKSDGWKIANDTPLPVLCFRDDANPDYEEAIAAEVAQNGKAWVTTTKLGCETSSVLRAGIANFQTQSPHLDALVQELNRARAYVHQRSRKNS